jgi:hypothetical protein
MIGSIEPTRREHENRCGLPPHAGWSDRMLCFPRKQGNMRDAPRLRERHPTLHVGAHPERWFKYRGEYHAQWHENSSRAEQDSTRSTNDRTRGLLQGVRIGYGGWLRSSQTRALAALKQGERTATGEMNRMPHPARPLPKINPQQSWGVLFLIKIINL